MSIISTWVCSPYTVESTILKGVMVARSLLQRLLRVILIGLATIGFMISSRPSEIPAILLIVPFVGMFTFLYLVIYEIIKFLGPDEDENGAIVQVRRPRLLAVVLAGFPVLLLVLQSIVELTLWDIVIALTILLLAYLYISRSSVSFWR